MNQADDTLPVREYTAGYVLFKRGDPAHKAYLLVSGEVEIFMPPATDAVARLGPGELLGEQAILSGACAAQRLLLPLTSVARRSPRTLCASFSVSRGRSSGP